MYPFPVWIYSDICSVTSWDSEYMSMYMWLYSQIVVRWQMKDKRHSYLFQKRPTLILGLISYGTYGFAIQLIRTVRDPQMVKAWFLLRLDLIFPCFWRHKINRQTINYLQFPGLPPKLFHWVYLVQSVLQVTSRENCGNMYKLAGSLLFSSRKKKTKLKSDCIFLKSKKKKYCFQDGDNIVCHIIITGIIFEKELFLYLYSQMSSPDLLGPKLEQHTEITWKAQVTVVCMTRWDGGDGVGITALAIIHFMNINPFSNDTDTGMNIWYELFSL